ncbi:MAG: histidine--tRNA ligase [Lachnospiraceae bacterium]|nr:histidine--tRNA ligase [Lachnospiraceae bacterium]MCI9133614.1 histidine--tRNA ligase [Lachnospiraceae bacterium]
MKFIKTPVKGMCDMLPADMRLREEILGMIKETYARYGFMQIETPAMEHIENLTSRQGGDNEKLIFQVLKRGAELKRALDAGKGELADSGLRYDLTVPLARYYANNKEKLPSPFKAFQTGNVWRADNPQKGRFRQFTQCDIDILGDETNLAEIELVSATAAMLQKIFARVGIQDFTIHINDRRILRGAALQAGFSEEEIPSVLISLDKFDKIGLGGIRAELLENGYPMERVDCYLSLYEQRKEGLSCREFCRDVEESCLDSGVVEGLEEIISCVTPMLGEGVKISFDPALVRGMGYYTGPIFEVSMDGYGFSIAGGGRYDQMIGKFCGQEICASGFSIGFERIITILKDHLQEGSQRQESHVAYLLDKRVPLEKKLEVFQEAARLREAGGVVTIQPMRKNVKRQVELLEAEGYGEFRKIYAD